MNRNKLFVVLCDFCCTLYEKNVHSSPFHNLPDWRMQCGVPLTLTIHHGSWTVPTLVSLSFLLFSGVFAVFQDSLIQALRREKANYPSHYWQV
jgi:hypothetical protein